MTSPTPEQLKHVRFLSDSANEMAKGMMEKAVNSDEEEKNLNGDNLFVLMMAAQAILVNLCYSIERNGNGKATEVLLDYYEQMRNHLLSIKEEHTVCLNPIRH